MRSPMNCWAGGGIILSCADIWYQVGSFCQPALVTLSSKHLAAIGCWVAAITAASSFSTSWQKLSGNSSLSSQSLPYWSGRTAANPGAGGAPAAKLLMLSPTLGAKAAIKISPTTLGHL